MSYNELANRMDTSLVQLQVCFCKGEHFKPMAVSRYLNVPMSESSNTPVYYHFKIVTYQGIQYLGLYYVFFFSTNPGYKCCCCCFMGRHSADVERMVILIDLVDLTPQHVFYGAHGNGQGTWVPYGKCEKDNDGRLRVYVSPTSHGLYPHPQHNFRACCFANDPTLYAGFAWTPQRGDFVRSWTQSWSNTSAIYQVAPGINNPKNVSDPETKSIKAWQRFFIMFPCVSKKLQEVPKVPALPLF